MAVMDLFGVHIPQLLLVGVNVRKHGFTPVRLLKAHL